MALSVLSCYVSYNVISRLGQRCCTIAASPHIGRQRRRNTRRRSRRLEADRNQSRTRICLAACSPAAARNERREMQTLYNVRKGTSSPAVNIEARRIARDTSPCQGVKAAVQLSTRFICASRAAPRPILIDYDRLLRKIESHLRGTKLRSVTGEDLPCMRY